jgi:DHA1 family multidrug resistance protein-like MFS transporter
MPLTLQSIRDMPAGQLLRSLGFQAWLSYPEEASDFQAPKFTTITSDVVPEGASTLEKTPSKISAIADVPQSEVSLHLSENGVSDATIVSWYENDLENPRNWSSLKKNWTLLIIVLYTFVVYGGASIIAPTAEFVMARYNISQDIANLGLSMYIVGCKFHCQLTCLCHANHLNRLDGIGPMFFSPVSEIPFVGRNPPYLISFALFFIISIILAVVDNFPAMVVLRFLQGLFGSPALASGAASIEDIYDMYSAPYGYIWWVAAMYSGPSFGPVLSAYAVFDNWRWGLWEMVIMAGIVLVLLPFLPETWAPTILLRRAKRLRARTENASYVAASELKPLNFGTTLVQALSKPIEISIKDPAITYACVYCAIVYATYYSFFEAFPIVYLGTYGMPLGGMSLIFTALSVGCAFGVVAYALYLRYFFIPRARQEHAEKGKPVEPEAWLQAGLVGVWGVPAGLLIFAWTARADIHWIAPTAGIAIWAAFSFVVFQSIICWLPPTYPRYVASLFAANDLTRSMLAAGFVQCTRPMYIKLGIDRGVTVLAGLSFLGVLGHYGLYMFGAKLRARSKFTDTAPTSH